MDVAGPKLLDDERFTQDLILVSPASFVTPNVRENAKLQHWVRAKAPLAYAINPFDSHLLHMFMQLLYSPMQANPLEVQYYSNVPFLLGAGLALFLYPRLSSADVPFASFALFLGVALSITAFPVLARILTDRKMHTTPLGVLALGCAALGDVTAWCLLAFVVEIGRASCRERVWR